MQFHINDFGKVGTLEKNIDQRTTALIKGSQLKTAFERERER